MENCNAHTHPPGSPPTGPISARPINKNRFLLSFVNIHLEENVALSVSRRSVTSIAHFPVRMSCPCAERCNIHALLPQYLFRTPGNGKSRCTYGSIFLVCVFSSFLSPIVHLHCSGVYATILLNYLLDSDLHSRYLTRDTASAPHVRSSRDWYRLSPIGPDLDHRPCGHNPEDVRACITCSFRCDWIEVTICQL
jgi:hypothetical protein